MRLCTARRLQWKQDVDKVFEGVEECPICYMIVHQATRALPRHRLRCDSWTECHCDGTTKRFDEEVDVGYVMDGVGPVDVAAHLRTGKAK